tara:strand:- start:8629 stop:8760 length:132 start_codon:yes stop_codon:yes gene_type:complete
VKNVKTGGVTHLQTISILLENDGFAPIVDTNIIHLIKIKQYEN